ncbi:MAG: NAD-dependent DNA ligase LigA, partial [Firmicutes bacterium]|nr:NAD-dependent DNA ligase LigA [Bacillota bacterium]
MDKTLRMKELIARLNEAAKAYYSSDQEIMSNFEYDALYDELARLEEETGVVMASSPTQRVGYEVVSELPKVTHPRPMKSLSKTKDIAELSSFLGAERGMLSWKLDGLTIVLGYEGGELVQAATRGNGEVGEVITPNARFFEGVPLKIPFTGHLVVRGEALISYENFSRINDALPAEEQYKNPRNLCSGSVRQLDSRIARERHVHVMVYTFVESDVSMEGFEDSKEKELLWLQSLGFDPVPYRMVDQESLPEAEQAFTHSVKDFAYPVDGLVLTLDSITRSAQLGQTAKFPRDSMAFKWQDEQAETTLREVEWSPSRTGLINPVAIFDPVELEGTTVQRASLHNVSIIRQLKLGLGDRIKVFKANMIIP